MYYIIISHFNALLKTTTNEEPMFASCGMFTSSELILEDILSNTESYAYILKGM